MKSINAALLALNLSFTLLPSTAIAGFAEGEAAFIAKDYATAMRELRPLAEQGNAVAQYRLGEMYSDGDGVPMNKKEAVKWYRLAAEQGNADAQYWVGWRYEYGGGGVPKDSKEAIKWLRLAAENGNVRAQTSLGYIYDLGLHGVPEDYKEAIKWFRLAAEQGDANAQSSLGITYEQGRGVPKNYKEAIKWYRLAAAQGDAEAKVKLSKLEKGSSASSSPQGNRQSDAKEDATPPAKNKTTNASPFGLEIGVATCEAAHAKLGVPYKATPDEDYFVFAKNPAELYPGSSSIVARCRGNLVVELEVKASKGGMENPASREAFNTLKSKYKLVNGGPMPSLGDGYARFAFGNTVIEQSAPHMSFTFTVIYYEKSYYQSKMASKAQDSKTVRDKKASSL